MTSEPMTPVSEFAQDDYGIKAAPDVAMQNYGYALLVITGGDGEVSPSEMDWLIRHQRKFGAPEHVIASYADFDYRNTDLRSLLGAISVDVRTWSAERHLVYHAIRICGVYGAAERAKVNHAAEVLAVEPDIVRTLHSLVAMEDVLTDMRKAIFRTET